MNAYAAAKEMALHYARKHLAIIKNSEFSREDKVKLIKIWLRLYNIPQTLANENKNHCSKCGRFSDGNTCDDCQSSASTESPKEEKKNKLEIKQIKAGYRGLCSLEKSISALKEGISHKDSYSNDVIFPHKMLTEHYIEGKRRKGNQPDPDRLKLLPYAIEATKKGSYRLKPPLFPGEQIPKGTQRIYTLNVKGRKTIFVYAYHDTGVVTGWYIP